MSSLWKKTTVVNYLDTKHRDLFDKTTHFAQFATSMRQDGVWGYRVVVQDYDGGRVLARLDMEGEESNWVLNGAANNYLGLAYDRRVIETTSKAVKLYGTSAQGASMLNGNIPLHRQLERELADFLGQEDAALAPAGFSAMTAVTQGILRPGDVVFADRFCHVSLMDGIRLSGAHLERYDHADMNHLRALLSEKRDQFRGALIVSDGVFSIDGAIAPVSDLVALAREFDCRLLIDDAHGIGTIGPEGRGCAVDQGVDLIAGVMSKALGAGGGFIAGPADVIQYLRVYGNAAISTSNLSISNTAASLAALRVLKAEPGRARRIQQMTLSLRDHLRQNGIDTLDSPAPILAIEIGPDADTWYIWRNLFRAGLLCHAMPFPLVPMNQAKIRVRLSLTMQEQDVREIGDILIRVLQPVTA
jgi:7-keto-8-aminopelargonate synthetase-like enzyme